MGPSSEVTSQVLKINLALSPPRGTSYLFFEEPPTETSLFHLCSSHDSNSFMFHKEVFYFYWSARQIPSLDIRDGILYLYIFCQVDPSNCTYSLKGDDSFLEALVFVLTLEAVDSLPRGIHLTFVVEVLTPSSNCPSPRGPDSLLEVPPPLRFWFSSQGAPDFEVLIPSSDTFVLEVLIPTTRCFFP